MIKPFYIDVDFKQKKQIKEPIVTQLDDLIFVITAYDNGRPAELEGTYKLVSKRPDNKSFYVDGNKTGDNEITFDIGKSEVEQTGRVTAVVQFIDNANQRLSSFPFTYTVTDDISLAKQPTSEEKTLLEIVVQDGPGLVEYFKEKQPLVEQFTNDQTEIRNQITQLSSEVESTSEQLAQTVKKDESGVLTWGMASQDFREQITGGNTAVVGDNAVLPINLVNGAATSIKRTRNGERAALICNTNIPNLEFSDTSRSLTFLIYTSFYTGRFFHQIQTDKTVTLPMDKLHHFIFINMSTGNFTVLNAVSGLSSLSENDVYVATVSFIGNQLRSIDIGSDYRVNGTMISRTGEANSVGTVQIKEGSVTTSKRSKLGAVAYLNFGAPYKLPNIDMANKKLQLYGYTFICWDNQRHSIGSTEAGVTEISFSDAWNDSGNSAYIYFNTETKTFMVYKSVQYANTKENDVFLCGLHKHGNTKELIGISALFDYTIDGKSPNASSASSDAKFTQLDPVPTDWYEAPTVEGYEANTQYVDAVNLNHVYDVYDALATSFPEYVTKTVLGNDATNTYPIHKYEFKPKVVSSNNNFSLPKIIITTGVHGEEKAAVLSLRNFMRDVANNWKTNKLLDYIRWNVHLIIIPIVNPYGFSHSTRKNGNGVDINRNFSYNYGTTEGNGSTDPADIYYQGTGAYSEVESQYVKSVIDSNLDTLACYDYHHNGTSGSAYDTMFYAVLKNLSTMPGKDEMDWLNRGVISKLTREGQKRYGIPSDSGFLGFVYYDHPQNSTTYAASLGITSATIECCKKMITDTQVYSPTILQLDTEFVGNVIFETARKFIK
jgi:hypothetical protein